MSDAVPLVTIGVPVYNGADFLPQALDSILSQSYSNLEVIVSDNASTDDTAAVCSSYARNDDRVKIVRQKTNIGVIGNWNAVARMASGRYFKWSSASDRCAPTFVEQCVRLMEADSTVVLVYSHTAFIDDENLPVSLSTEDPEARSELASERFKTICSRLVVNNAQQGVIRTSALRQTGLDRPYPGGDMVLMAELALLGKYVLIPEPLLFRRASARTWTPLRTIEEKDKMFWPAGAPRLRLHSFRTHWDYFLTALRSPLSWKERLRSMDYACRIAYWERRELLRDLRELVSARSRPNAQ